MNLRGETDLTNEIFYSKISHEVRILVDELFYANAADHFIRQLARTRRNPDLKKVRDLSSGENGVLLYLVLRPEGATPGELGKALGIGSGGVANLLTVLEKKDCIRRSVSPKDRRITIVSATDSGRKVIADLRSRTQKWLGNLLEALGEEDTRELIRIYERIIQISCGERSPGHSA